MIMTPRERLARTAYEAWATAKAAEASWFEAFPWDDVPEMHGRWLAVADALLIDVLRDS